jgi:hypothetical protein
MFRIRISARHWIWHRLALSIRGRGLTGTPRWGVIRRHRCRCGILEMTTPRQHRQEAQAGALMQIHYRAMISRRHSERVAKHGSKCVSYNLKRTWRKSEGAHARTGSRSTGPKGSNNYLRRPLTQFPEGDGRTLRSRKPRGLTRCIQTLELSIEMISARADAK